MEQKERDLNNVCKDEISNEVKNNEAEPFFCPKVVLNGFKQLSVKEIVLALLRERNWTQVDLSNRIGLSKSSLNNYISERWATPTQIKIKIAQALEVDSSVIWDLEK